MAQSKGLSGAVPNKPVYGIETVNNADTIVARSRNRFEVKPTLKALRFSDRQFHTMVNSCSVACTKAIACASPNGRPHT